MLRQIRTTALKSVVTGAVVVGALEVTTHLPSEGRSSELYHDICDKFALPIVRAVLDPEDAHNLAIEVVKRGWAPRHRQSGRYHHRVDTSSTPFRDRTLIFPNCVGLAAGFDKDGVAIKNLFETGFGFVEIGSVTPLPQPGNSRPRMFRLHEDLGVINRYGFNSIGLDGVEANVKAFLDERLIKVNATHNETGVQTQTQTRIDSGILGSLELYAELLWHKFKSACVPKASTLPPGVLGINLGKNRNSDDMTADYTKGIRQLGPCADYIVINISSPNTPGLRSLQEDEQLRCLLRDAIKERNSLPSGSRFKRGVVLGQNIPLLVKISPDLDEEEMKVIADAVLESGVDGLVISNTSVSRPRSLLSKHKNELGGLSGVPIRDLSTQCIRTMYRLTDGNIPIIGVGGISSGHDVYEKLRAGASLVQLYSMLVYEGPGLVSRIQTELESIMLENGHRRVDDIVGLDHEDIYWKKKEEKMRSNRVNEPVIVSA